MRSYLFTLCLSFTILFFLSNELKGQEYYYDYRGKRIPLSASKDKISIKFNEGITQQQVNAFLDNELAAVRHIASRIRARERLYMLSLTETVDISELLERLRTREIVEFIDHVYLEFDDQSELIPCARFVVKFKPGVSESEIKALNSENHVEVVRENRRRNRYVLRIASESKQSLLSVVQHYSDDSRVEYAVPDFLRKLNLHSIPNDSLFSHQFYLTGTKVPEAWDISNGSSSITVAIIDDGGEVHPDLPAGRLAQGLDLWDNDNDPLYNDLLLDGTESGRNSYHGIACAGIVAATQNNNTGISGIAPNCKIMLVRIFGEGGFYDPADVPFAINYAWENGAAVISMSFGDPLADPGEWQYDDVAEALEDAMTLGRNGKGCVAVASLGNNGIKIECPANVPGVIGVGAIDEYDDVWYYSPPGSTNPQDRDAVDVVAYSGWLSDELGCQNWGDCLPQTEHCRIAPMGNIWTLDRPAQPGRVPGNYNICQGWTEYIYNPPLAPPENNVDYTARFAGTSAACPQVSGLAALILSVNPDLTWSEVQAIIDSTADDLYTTGFDQTSGWGRINAYQALLLALAYSNKSIDTDATAHNSGRRLVRDGSGNYHLVFHSGGEIFYRKNAGGSWLAPQRLSSANGSNSYPSITVRGSNVFVTWQRKNGSTHDIWFHRSSDGGASWPPAHRTTLATSVGSSDPLPVITTPETNNVVVVYRKGNYLESKHLNDNGSVLATKSRTGPSLNSPTVANVNQQPTGSPTTALVYASGDNHIYYHYYTGSNWSSAWNLSIIVPGTNVSKTPSISCEGVISQPLHVAWHLSSGGGFGHIYYRKSTNHNTWPSQYTQLFYGDQYRPSITAFSSTSIDLLYQASMPQTYKQHFNGSSWSFPSFVGDGQYPSLSTGSTQAKYVWTSSGSAPFTINLSTEILSKENDDKPSYERAISWLDSLGSHLTLRVKNLSLKTRKGEIQTLALQPVSLDTVADFTPANAFDYLVSAPTLLPVDAESLVVNCTLWAENVEKIGSGNRPKISLEFRTSGDQLLHRISGPEFIARGSIAEKTLRFAAPLAAVMQAANSTSIKAVLKIEGLSPESKVFASLGHIYDFTKAVSKDADLAMLESDHAPKSAALFNNYPNPFNPETVIQFQIPQSAHVTLKIYNLIGQEVRTLVNRFHDAGIHEIRWDGKDSLGRVLPSGLYLYRIEAGEYTQVRKMALLR